MCPNNMIANTAPKIPEPTEKQYIEANLSGLAETVAFLGKEVNPHLTARQSLNDRDAAILGTFYRMYLCANSVLKLNEARDFQLAVSGARTLFELLVDLRHLLQDNTGKSVEMFTAFSEVERFRVAEKLSAFATTTGAKNVVAAIDIDHATRFASDSTRKAAIEARITAVWGLDKNSKPKWPKNHWSGIDLHARCQNLGIRYQTMYFQIYAFSSWYSHSGPAGYANIDQEGFGRILSVSADVMRVILLEGLEILVTEFSLDKKIKSLPAALAFLKEAPEKILTAELLKEFRMINASNKDT